MPRIVGLDVGKRRIGVAISDATATLARPSGMLNGNEAPASAADTAAEEIARLAAEEDGVTSVVVGLPRRLDGSPNEMTPYVERFVERLRARIALPVFLQDERLSSHEAERRLATRIRDWRVRKGQLDAASAAIILQDFLDMHPARPVDVATEPEL